MAITASSNQRESCKCSWNGGVYITNLIWVIKRPTAEEDAGDQNSVELGPAKIKTRMQLISINCNGWKKQAICYTFKDIKVKRNWGRKSARTWGELATSQIAMENWRPRKLKLESESSNGFRKNDRGKKSMFRIWGVCFMFQVPLVALVGHHQMHFLPSWSKHIGFLEW